MARCIGGFSMTKAKNICKAEGCDKPLLGNHPHQKYCCHQCRWREYRRKKMEDRIKNKKCPQCGGDKEDNNRTYCDKCAMYYQKRYYTNKGDNDE